MFAQSFSCPFIFTLLFIHSPTSLVRLHLRTIISFYCRKKEGILPFFFKLCKHFSGLKYFQMLGAFTKWSKVSKFGKAVLIGGKTPQTSSLPKRVSEVLLWWWSLNGDDGTQLYFYSACRHMTGHLSSRHRFGRARPAELGAKANGHSLCDARRIFSAPGALSRPQPRHLSIPDIQHHSARSSFTRYRSFSIESFTFSFFRLFFLLFFLPSFLFFLLSSSSFLNWCFWSKCDCCGSGPFLCTLMCV